MKDKLAALIETRKIIAFAILIVFCYLSMSGKIDAKITEYVIVSVISFYFGKSTALDRPSKD